jgi:hypothetical protein
MTHLPPSSSRLLPSLLVLLCPFWVCGQNPGAAVSSQAVTTQPSAPGRLSLPKNQPKPIAQPAPPPLVQPALDPLLDPNRPKNCQLQIFEAQTISCAGAEVVLPVGTYRQVKIVEGPQERTAAASVDLKAQAQGLGYIRYLAEEKLKVNGEERSGGIDVGVRPSDGLPVRIWYKKFNPPDDVTKAISFILPPVMIVAGAGAWSSGNVLIPNQDPVFNEARDFYLKDGEARTAAGTTEDELMKIKPAEAARSGSSYPHGSAARALRSR